MIQRIQTLWLLLAAAASTATLRFPFYSGSNASGGYAPPLTSSSGFLTLILAIAVAVLALVTIFLYKNRKRQIQLVLGAVLLQVAILALLFSRISDFTQGTLSLTAVFAFLVPVFLVLAWWGIRKDEALVRSMDRLR
ncbi:MAG TPA: DUF4293 domain-containing protein [Lacibacter sp.]|nr:DUF4293 domain-containing protein [Lacibacter sp.]HMO87803.1 DUF4293 domain-containing protein [Lacibacter sp.]HMP87512.1 DUF4293 domain-containing protein [Lacibacter sp.]